MMLKEKESGSPAADRGGWEGEKGAAAVARLSRPWPCARNFPLEDPVLDASDPVNHSK